MQPELCGCTAHYHDASSQGWAMHWSQAVRPTRTPGRVRGSVGSAGSFTRSSPRSRAGDSGACSVVAVAVACVLACAPGFASATGSTAAAAPSTPWRQSLQWRDQTASIEPQPGGAFLLHHATGDRRIAAQPMSSDTASPLFDGLFALAQAELDAAKVASITDGAFDRGQPIPCPCFETGEKWRYV